MKSDFNLNGGLEYKRLPDRHFKKWSNLVVRKEFRKIEKMLIECMKRKDTLGKNAQTVYQKYKDKIKQLEADKEEAEELIGELNDKIIELEDALK